MTTLETQIRSRLHAELDPVEPSPLAWHLLQARRRPAIGFRPYMLAVASLAAAAVAAAVLLSLPGGERRDERLLTTEPRDVPGVVLDEAGDANVPYLDLVRTGVQVREGSLIVTWSVAAPLPDDPAPVDFRLALAEGSEVVVIVARLDGDSLQAGVGRCPVREDGTGNCAGRSFMKLERAPSVEGAEVTVEVPLEDVGIRSLSDVRWTSYVQNIRR